MSKVAKFVAKVASVVAVVAAVAAAATGNPALSALLLKVSAVAGAVGAVAGTVAQMTAKRPPARGSPNLITIGANQPMPIVLGETYVGGNKVHEVGYGGTVGKVENPYKFQAIIHSGCGPIQQFTGLYADFAAVALTAGAATGYFAGFLYAEQKLGERPESAAISPYWAGAPDWSTSHKLSGYAATGLNLKFDKDGKVFSSGEPQWGTTLKGVKVYDPRLDSTYPGGSGAQRINDRSTWQYSENPGVVGLTYAYGWFHEGKKQGGIGMPVEGIDLGRWVEFANICDANQWKIGGAVYEPGSRWDNLKDICAAGGGEPYFDRHLLGVNYNAPRVSLDTITADDIADDGFTVSSGRTWRERLNTIAPKYRSAAHKWEYVPAADVSVPAYVTDDGEEKREEITWNLVQNKDQAAQLAAYELVNRREIGQIEVSCKPRLMRYSVGDMLTFNLPDTVLDGLDAIIIRPPEINPDTGEVRLTMLGETAGKHDFALGKTTTAPPAPSLVNTAQLDNASSTNNGSDALNTAMVYLYQRNNTGIAPALPTAALTYTFSTALLSGGALSGWSQSVPVSSGGKYLFVSTQVALSSTTTATISPTAWAAVQILAQDGEIGDAAISGFLTKETIQLFSFGNGAVVSYASAAGNFRIFSGSTDISSYFSLSTVSNPQALTTSYSGQSYSVTGGFDNNEETATLGIRATGSGPYAGVTLDKVLSLAKSKPGYEIFSTLPTTELFEGRIVYLSTDDKLYRYTGSAWTSAVEALDISGQITNAQIAGLEASKLAGQITTTQITDNAISTPKINAGAITTAKVAAGAIQALQIDALAVNADKIAANAIVADKIAASAITTDKINAGAITAAKLATTELITVTAQIKDGIISNAKIGNLTADKITSGTISTSLLSLDGLTLSNIGGALAISTGGVATTNIANNAVSTLVSAYSTGTVSTTTSGTVLDLQSVSITSTGSPILVNASSTVLLQLTGASLPTAASIIFSIDWQDNLGNTGALGSNVLHTSVHTTNTQTNTIITIPAIHSGSTAGRTYTYIMRAVCTNANLVGLSGRNHRIMTAQEVKR